LALSVFPGVWLLGRGSEKLTRKRCAKIKEKKGKMKGLPLRLTADLFPRNRHLETISIKKKN